MLLANDIANSWKFDFYYTETLDVSPLHSYYCESINTDCGMQNKFIKKVKGQAYVFQAEVEGENWFQADINSQKVKYQLGQSLTAVMGSSMADCGVIP